MRKWTIFVVMLVVATLMSCAPSAPPVVDESIVHTIDSRGYIGHVRRSEVKLESMEEAALRWEEEGYGDE